MNTHRFVLATAICIVAAIAFLAWFVGTPVPTPFSAKPDSSRALGQAEGDAQAHPILENSASPTGSARGGRHLEENSPPTPNPRGPFRREPPPAAVNVDVADLTKRADEGDSAAAYNLSMKLFRCSILYARYERLQDAIESGRKTQEAGNTQLGRLDEEYRSCKGLSKDDYEKRFEYIRRAADAGDMDAQIDFLSIYGQSLDDPEHALNPEWIRTYKERGVSYLKSAVSKGSIDAMSALAMVYWEGLIVEKNGVLAYAYMYAAARSGLAPSAHSALRMWEQSLGAEDVSRARAIGAKIYRGCCE